MVRIASVIESGTRFGRFQVIQEVEPRITPRGTKERLVDCLCDCGTRKTVLLASLKKGITASCGCKKKEFINEYKTKNKEKVEPGTIYGRLKVVQEIDPYVTPKGAKTRRFECVCECGNTTFVNLPVLKNGRTKSCGCLLSEVTSERRTSEVVLETRYGSLTLLQEVEPYCNPNGTTRRKFLCACDCGNFTEVILAYLVNGHTRSCGCLRVEVAADKVRTHSLSKSPEYGIWHKIKERCTKPCHGYSDRGIKICERWLKFENFFEDMGPRPTPKHSIDRVDVNGDYCPENTRWATPKQQARNKRNTVYMTFDGQKKCVEHWAEELGCKTDFIRYHLKVGKTPEWIVEQAKIKSQKES